MEDKFLTAEHAKAISNLLDEAGFKYVLALHKTDPAWREQYRSSRPELDGWMWSIRLDESFVPMGRIQKLIAICEISGLTFWLSSYGEVNEEGTGPQLCVNIKAAQ